MYRARRNCSGIFVVAVACAACLVAFFFYLQSSQSESVSPSQSSDDESICLKGCPTGGPSGTTIVRHHILTLANDPRTKFADWVAYRLSAETFGKHCKREWQRDPDLPADETLAPQDFASVRKALNADRGHQAPLASLCGSPYWQEADYLSNVTPQRSTLNEGAWEHLERAERGLVYSGYARAVYSITGPLYEREIGSLPRAHLPHVVPSGYWKVISVQQGDEVSAVGFIMDQDLPRDYYYCQTVVPIAQIEARSSLHFYPGLDQIRREALEKLPSGELVRALHC